MVKSKKFITLCKKYGVNPDKVNEVMSFEQACEITGDDPTQLPIVDKVAVRHQKRLIADYKLSIITEALRDNKRPDYNNADQWKYFPVFEVHATKENPSGSSLSFFLDFFWRRNASVGVRLCTLNSDSTRFSALHFAELHKDHQLYT